MDLLNRISGYMVLSVKGEFPERFLNLCALKGICLKNVEKREDEVVLQASKKAFRQMIQPAYRSGCKVRILKKAGVYYRWKKVKKRKILLLGAVAFVALLFLLNSFIWSIRIDGNENLTEEEIKFVADYCGLRQGVVKYKLDEKKFSENVIKCEPRIAWIWPEIKGTVCYLHVREKAIHDPPVNTKEPCDIIAGRSGIIKSVTVKRGFAAVSEGDSVVKGQLLISSEKEGFSPVHAMGDVYVYFWEEVKGRAVTEKETVTYTGKEKHYYSVVIGSFGMSFRFSGKAPFESFEINKEEDDIKLFGEIVLPLKIKKTEYKETVKDTITISIESAVEEERQRIEKEYISALPKGVSLENTVLKTEMVSRDEALVTVVFRCSQNIALKQMRPG